MRKPNDRVPLTVGAYFYGWYDAPKWRAHRHPFVPQVGYYDSTDPLSVKWQVELIARSGIDYVIFEMPPPSDHSFEHCMEHARQSIALLEGTGVGFTFLVDLFVFEPGVDRVATYADSFAELKRRGWLDRVVNLPGRGPTVFTFAADPGELAALDAVTPPGIKVYATTWSPIWGVPRREDFEPRIWDTHAGKFDLAIRSGERLDTTLEPLGFVHFWAKSEQIASMNGFAAVSPGYDDLMLERDPQLAEVLPRNDGQTLVEQFKAAAESGAPDILLYSWNEIYESSGIEPSLEFGDFYYELTGKLIAQARAGEPIHMPADLPPPRPAAPIYLSEGLRNSAERYPDRVPRWGFDDYAAKVALTVSSPVVMDGRAFFGPVEITNAGDMPWRVGSERLPIRLGVRLRDEAGAVVREGRTHLGRRDIASGATLTVDGAVEIAGLARGVYQAELGVVWDGRMWMPGTVGVSVIV
jgi:hypothetical protein